MLEFASGWTGNIFTSRDIFTHRLGDLSCWLLLPSLCLFYDASFDCSCLSLDTSKARKLFRPVSTILLVDFRDRFFFFSPSSGLERAFYHFLTADIQMMKDFRYLRIGPSFSMSLSRFQCLLGYALISY